MAVAPLGPEIGGLGGLTITFTLFCFCLLAFGLVRGATLLVQSVHFIISNTVGRLPLVGGLVGSITDPVFAAVERGFADAAIGVQGAMGFYWHGTATIASWTAREVVSHAHLLERIVHYALPSTWAELAWSELGKHRHILNSLGVGIDRIAHRFGNWELTLPGRVEGIVGARTRGITDTINHVLYPDIAGLRSRTRSLTDRLDTLWQHVRKLDALLGTAAFTEAVAVALAALGASWIRCRNWNKVGKHVCGLPTNLIEDVLALTLAWEVVVDPVALAEAALVSEDALEGIIDKIAA